MTVGALTSIGTSMTNAINGYSLSSVLSVSFFSKEYLGMLFTAFLLGIMGAIGGLMVRECYKFIIRKVFPDKYKDNNYED